MTTCIGKDLLEGIDFSDILHSPCSLLFIYLQPKQCYRSNLYTVMVRERIVSSERHRPIPGGTGTDSLD